jgi:hypothetical protein
VTDQPAKPRRGCFFYGCLTCVVLLGLVMGALLLGLHYVKKVVNRFTDTQPMALPTVQMPQDEVDKLRKRFEAFQAAVREQRPSSPLTLTSDDINALVASGTGREALKGKVYVSLEGDQLKGQVSVPLREVGLGMFKGRYLNGTATFGMSLHNGLLVVSPRTILVKGNPLPETFMQKLRQENLAAGIVKSPEAVAVLQGLEDIQVKDGKLVVVPKTREGERPREP